MTLLEVMIASGLLAMFIIGALGFIVQASRVLEHVRLRTEAVALAWNRIERARHMDFAAVEALVEHSPGVRINQFGMPDIDGWFRRRTLVSAYTNGLPMRGIRVEVDARNRRTGSFDDTVAETIETVLVQIQRAEIQP